MSNPVISPAETAVIPAGPAIRRIVASGLLLQFAMMWAAFFILAASINWPASLDEPPAVMLPLVLENANAVFVGYLCYLFHALILVPLAVMTGRTLFHGGMLAALAVAFGVLAGFAKALGIVRWLVLMPDLAFAHADPATSDASRDAIAVVYVAFNAYAGGVGELMGVGLFAGIWTILLSVGVMRHGARWLGIAGLAAATLLFATLSSAAGIDAPALLTISGICWQLWAFALAVWHLRRA